MKQEDRDRFKAMCEREGFEYHLADSDESLMLVYVNAKDPWKDAEFFRHKFNNDYYRVDRVDEQYIYAIDGSVMIKDNCEVISESSYVEQLKKEAFERFVEIKKGDVFKSLSTGSTVSVDINVYGSFFYSKENDAFYIGGTPLYCQGKWAERVKERVEVNYFSYRTNKIDQNTYLHECIFKSNIEYFGEDVNIFIATQLEKYLNGEIE